MNNRYAAFYTVHQKQCYVTSMLSDRWNVT